MSLTRRARTDVERFGWPGSAWPSIADLWSGMAERAELRVEERRDGDTLVVRVEAPGIDPDEDAEITVADHMLQIHVERRTEERTEEGGAVRSEFRYGSFSRTLPLPPDVDDTDVTATYTDGILEVRLPIDGTEDTARRIPVARG